MIKNRRGAYDFINISHGCITPTYTAMINIMLSYHHVVIFSCAMCNLNFGKTERETDGEDF